MIEVCLMEFDREKRHFSLMENGVVQLPNVPTKGDKFVHNVDRTGYIHDVYDVHYSVDGIDVNLIRLSTITEHNSSRFPDIA